MTFEETAVAIKRVTDYTMNTSNKMHFFTSTIQNMMDFEIFELLTTGMNKV